MGSCLSDPQQSNTTDKSNKSTTSTRGNGYKNYDPSEHQNTTTPIGDIEEEHELFALKNLLSSHLKQEEKLISFEQLYPLQRLKHIFEIYHKRGTMEAKNNYNKKREQKQDFDYKNDSDLDEEYLQSNNGKIYSLIHQECGDYNNTKLLNDYYYILFHYDDSLEMISNYLIHSTRIDPLSKQSIKIFERNYRDRSKQASERRNTVSPKYAYKGFGDDPQEINTVQLIDRIYCYFIHTFKMGYKLRVNDYMEDPQQNEDDMKLLETNLEDFGDYHVIRDNKIFEINAIIKEKADAIKNKLNATKFMRHKYYINMGSFDGQFGFDQPEQSRLTQPNIQHHRSLGMFIYILLYIFAIYCMYIFYIQAPHRQAI